MADRLMTNLEPDATTAVTKQVEGDTAGHSLSRHVFPKDIDYGLHKSLWVRYSADEKLDLLDIFHDGTVKDENEINRARVRQYREQLTTQFLDAIRESDFEFGYDSIADFFVRQKLSENSLAIKEWLNELFIEYYDNFAITAGVMRVIAHLDYEQIKPQGPTMALAALCHASVEIKELGVRAFENWGTVESLTALESIEITEDWLLSYLTEVIGDLRGNLKHGGIGS